MTVTGPDFIALQVRDVEKAAAFYETHLQLCRDCRSAVRRPPSRGLDIKEKAGQ